VVRFRKIRVTRSDAVGEDKEVLLPCFVCFYLKLKAFYNSGTILAKRESKHQEKISKYTADGYQSYSLLSC